MKIGFIGMGNMAQALCAGFVKEALTKEEVFAYAPNQEKLNRNAEKIGFTACESLSQVASRADTLIMACKPYQIDGVLREVGKLLKGKALVSIAAGWDFEKYHLALGDAVRIQYVMPNTPAMVGEGVLLFEDKNSLQNAEREEITRLFETTGKVVVLPSHLMKVGMALTGCGPAFVDLFLEAYGEVAVKYGIPLELAQQLISQTVLGTARLQQETGKHPAVLRGEVCSPGGTTIKGVIALEKAGFQAACIESIEAIMEL